jgi:iron(III) transport system permease protein
MKSIVTEKQGFMANLPSARLVTLVIAAFLFVALCLLPTVYMFGVSLTGPDGGFSIDNYRRLFMDARQRKLLLDSTLIGAGAAALATCVGVPLGLLLARTDVPAKRLLRLLFVVPLVIPPYILGLAWIYIGSSTGLMAQIFGRDLLSGWTYSLTGAIIVLGTGFYPLSMLATEAAARRMEGHLEEAALLAANPSRVVWRITLPLIAPSITAAALIIFVLSLSEFGVPSLLRVPVFTTEVFTAFAALYDFGAATALAVPLLLVALITGVAVVLVSGDRMITTRRSAYAGLRYSLGHWKPAVIALLAAVLLVTVALPLAVLARETGQPGRMVAAVQASGGAIANSLLLSGTGATLIVALSALLGYGIGRAPTRLRTMVELALLVVFAVPSTVVGIGLIDLWNRPGLPGEIYKSPLIILIGYLARFVPVAALILAANVRQTPLSLEEAAAVAGAPWPKAFGRIVLPQLRAGLLAAWVVAFIFAFGELGATVLVAPPGTSTLPVQIYTLIANAPSSEVAALALMQVGIVLIPLVLVGVFLRGEG